MTFFICMFVLLMQFLWKYVDDMVGKGLDWSVLGELLFYASFGLLPYAFPLSMLIASIMAFGSLGENYELTAMKASGISLLRIMRPLMVLALFVSLLAFYFANNVLPHTNLRFVTLLWSVKQQRPELVLKEGVFTNDIDGYSIRVDHKNRKTNMLYGLLIYDHTKNKANESVTVADSGSLRITDDKKYFVMTMYDGINYYEEEANNRSRNRTFPHREDHFKEQVINIRVRDFEFKRSDESNFRNSYRMLNIKQLTVAEDSLHSDYSDRINDFASHLSINNTLTRRLAAREFKNDSIRNRYLTTKADTLIDFDKTFSELETWRKQEIVHTAISEARSNNQQINSNANGLFERKKIISKHEMERHRKFTLSIAVLLFFFIGAPLGAIIRKGGLGMPVVVSVFLFILYYIVSMTGEKSAREDLWNMFVGMWFSSFIFFPVGAWLSYKAVTDSAIMRAETYSDFFKKIQSAIRLKWGKHAGKDSPDHQ